MDAAYPFEILNSCLVSTFLYNGFILRLIPPINLLSTFSFLFSKSAIISWFLVKSVCCRTFEMIDDRILWLLHQRYRADIEFVKCKMLVSLFAASAFIVSSRVKSMGCMEKELSVRLAPKEPFFNNSLRPG